MALSIPQYTVSGAIGAIPQYRRMARSTTTARMDNSTHHNPHTKDVAGCLSCSAVGGQGWHKTPVRSLCLHIVTLHISLGSDILRLRTRPQFEASQLRRCSLVGIYEYDHRRLIANTDYRHWQNLGCNVAVIWNVGIAPLHGLHLAYIYADKKGRCLNTSIVPIDPKRVSNYFFSLSRSRISVNKTSSFEGAGAGAGAAGFASSFLISLFIILTIKKTQNAKIIKSMHCWINAP